VDCRFINEANERWQGRASLSIGRRRCHCALRDQVRAPERHEDATRLNQVVQRPATSFHSERGDSGRTGAPRRLTAPGKREAARKWQSTPFRRRDSAEEGRKHSIEEQLLFDAHQIVTMESKRATLAP